MLTPGWTSYHEHIQYQTYDVTDLLQSGDNAVGAYLGDGWYRGNLGWGGNRNVYGRKLALLAEIRVQYENGDSEIIGTDDSWRCSTGPLLMSDIYNGETYDARLKRDDWAESGFDDSDWKSVTVQAFPKDNLIAPVGPPIRKIEEIKPIDILVTPAGDTVVDMGQNMVGWVRLRVQGQAGQTVTLRHAEVLDKAGNFYTENLRSADQTNCYTLNGEGVEIYEPRFTFQGFRYVAVDDYPGDLTLEAITGVVVHSDIAPTGSFECSNDMLNQLQHNIQWGLKGNFLDVPTDCPQRDDDWDGPVTRKCLRAQPALMPMSPDFTTSGLRI
ncbi:MAG: family 78 glycoside hydrolase catalytic domain [candidate division KSB1 bacterium]|nr:family 78 glycoside hydrolase catalytic domain [candidate division KSB1 bacterium]